MALSLVLRQTTRYAELTKFSGKFLKKNQSNITCGISTNLVRNSNLLKAKTVAEIVSKRSMSGDHGVKWKLEKILTILLIPVIPATFLKPGTEALDNLFAILVMTHAHIGLEAISRDYIRPVIFGPLIPKLAVGTVYALTAGTLASLLYFNHHNIGIGAAGVKIWSIGKKTKQENC